MHENLVDNGCGAISVEPDYFVDVKTGKLEKAFYHIFMPQNGQESHVRVMVRK
ncbi:MAG: hypothetical protein H6940_05075 [Burkholderiales bacterium]|nr:hypothetical protein [Burkholderiales bacterium]